MTDPQTQAPSEATEELTLTMSFTEFVELYRGVETPCERCRGLGTIGYSDTSTWRRRPSGQMMTTDVCDKCWGTGDAHRPGPDARAAAERIAELEYQLAEEQAATARDNDVEAVREKLLSQNHESRREWPAWLKAGIVVGSGATTQPKLARRKRAGKKAP